MDFINVNINGDVIECAVEQEPIHVGKGIYEALVVLPTGVSVWIVKHYRGDWQLA